MVADFGLARFVNLAAVDSTKTMGRGTPGYMAREMMPSCGDGNYNWKVHAASTYPP